MSQTNSCIELSHSAQNGLRLTMRIGAISDRCSSACPGARVRAAAVAAPAATSGRSQRSGRRTCDQDQPTSPDSPRTPICRRSVRRDRPPRVASDVQGQNQVVAGSSPTLWGKRAYSRTRSVRYRQCSPRQGPPTVASCALRAESRLADALIEAERLSPPAAGRGASGGRTWGQALPRTLGSPPSFRTRRWSVMSHFW